MVRRGIRYVVVKFSNELCSLESSKNIHRLRVNCYVSPSTFSLWGKHHHSLAFHSHSRPVDRDSFLIQIYVSPLQSTDLASAGSTERQQVESGSTQEPVIIGSMQVPEKDLSVRIVIKRNVDEALSASHLIELRFDLPQGFDGQGVEEIARFVMKNTEEARGEALVAVPVKVSEGFFLVALDNLPQAVEVNTQLLEAGGWIDIPVSYSTGRRALLTLEKGTSGRAAFEEAFNDWKNRQ